VLTDVARSTLYIYVCVCIGCGA